MSLRILHTADWHTREKDIEECSKVLDAMCKHAIAISGELDLIVVAGDLTDRNDVKFDSQTARLVMQTVTWLSMAAPVVIISGTKYHDGNIPELLDGTNIHAYYPVAVSTRPEQFVLGKDNEFYPLADNADAKMLISTIPTPTKQYFESRGGIEETDRAIGEAMTAIFADMGMTAGRLNIPHVPIGHWQVGGAYVSETQQLVGRDIEVSVDQILSARPSVACLGHIHYAQQIRNHPVFYSGSSYRKDFGEMEDKGFWIHTVPEQGIGYEYSEWVELPTRKLVKVEHNYASPNAEPDTDPRAIIGQYSPENIEGAHVRIGLRVWQDQRDQVDRAQLKQDLIDMGAAQAEVHIVGVPRQNVRAEEVLQAERLRDKVLARAEIVGDTVAESILEKCDALEMESKEEIVEKTEKAA